MTGEAPGWLTDWRRDGLAPEAALTRFDALGAVEVHAMIGRWRGMGLPTGHPLDGLLERLGWWGKSLEAPDRAHPLLFEAPGGPVAIEPALMPVQVALQLPRLAQSRAARAAFLALRPVLRARGPAADLRPVAFRGKTSAAMLYRRQPITDHFRLAGPDRVLGLMERRGMERPYFFLLERPTA